MNSSISSHSGINIGAKKLHPSYTNFSLVPTTATRSDLEPFLRGGAAKSVRKNASQPHGSNGNRQQLPANTKVKGRRGPCLKSLFPSKLHELLSDPDFSDVIAWLPHGRSWLIRDPNAFMKRVGNTQFSQSTYASFKRQVCLWGFRRKRQGADRGSYYHELFLRGMPHLVQYMEKPLAASPAEKQKMKLDLDEEPNLGHFSAVFPVPGQGMPQHKQQQQQQQQREQAQVAHRNEQRDILNSNSAISSTAASLTSVPNLAQKLQLSHTSYAVSQKLPAHLIMQPLLRRVQALQAVRAQEQLRKSRLMHSVTSSRLHLAQNSPTTPAPPPRVTPPAPPPRIRIAQKIYPSYTNFSLVPTTATRPDMEPFLRLHRGAADKPSQPGSNGNSQQQPTSTKKKGKRGPCLKSLFPSKLHEILSDPSYSDVITWMPHGRSWSIPDPNAFIKRVGGTTFSQSNFSSFKRQVCLWGFWRKRQGEDQGSYYHELFLRGMPHLVQFMEKPLSAEAKQKLKPSLDEEPDLCMISMAYPVPQRKQEQVVQEGRKVQMERTSPDVLRMPSSLAPSCPQRPGAAAPAAMIAGAAPRAPPAGADRRPTTTTTTAVAVSSVAPRTTSTTISTGKRARDNHPIPEQKFPTPQRGLGISSPARGNNSVEQSRSDGKRARLSGGDDLPTSCSRTTPHSRSKDPILMLAEAAARASPVTTH